MHKRTCKKFLSNLLFLIILSSLILACNRKSNEYVIELDPQYNVSTEELLKKFPIKYQTKAKTDLTKKVQNRMLNGFNRWNMGYDAWEHWGEVLYHKDSIYNVNGVRMTLKEYQNSQNAALKKLDIKMGNFSNMILVDDWMAIQYDITTLDKEKGTTTNGTTMKFARFGDYGKLGAKVDEGFGGSRNDGYYGMLNFLNENEKEKQNIFIENIAYTKLKDTTNLEEKYPIVYPTTIDTDKGKEMKNMILEYFESWNNGYDTWNDFIKENYNDNIMYDHRGIKCTKDNLNLVMKDLIDNEKTVRINNILISEDWAAVHFWNSVNMKDGTKDAFNHMQFIHFVEDTNGKLKIDMCFAK